MTVETVLTLIGIVLGAEAVWKFGEFLITRKDKKKDNNDTINSRFDKLENRLDEIDEKIDKNEAQRARTQILRFNDELYMGKIHTKEHFDEILAACDSYNKYCDTHPDFENMRTVKAQERISEVYDKCSKNHLFLDNNDEEDKL